MNRRKIQEVRDAERKFSDLVWFRRHCMLELMHKSGEFSVEPEIWDDAKKAATMIGNKYPTGELYPQSEYDWGFICGKLSALRWMLGADWDDLNT